MLSQSSLSEPIQIAVKISAPPSEARGWAPEEPWVAPQEALDPLLVACELNHNTLINSLLALPNLWSVNAKEPANRKAPGVSSVDAGRSALHLILRSGGGNSSSHESNSTLAQSQALEMVRRGFNFLGLDASGQSALSIAVLHGREAFITGLKGHPDFVYANIKDMRAGPAASEPAKPDQRDSLIGHLIRTGRLEAVKALVTNASWPINDLDCAGRRPLGYAKTSYMTAALLKLGADPTVSDLDGKTPTARAQANDITQERDKMIGLIAVALRKSGAKNDPAMLAQLQEESLPALLKAAFDSPKSSMLKIISSFGFSVVSTRDPITGVTPLMRALHGGRLSSALHLINAGCSINEQDAQGLSTSAYLLLGFAASGSARGGADHLYKELKPSVDWTLVNNAGFPASFHPFLIPTPIRSGQLSIALERAIVAGSSDNAPLIGPNGESLIGAYAKAMCRSNNDWAFYRNLAAAVEKTLSLGQPNGVDDILEVALNKAARNENSFSNLIEVFRVVTTALSAGKASSDILIKSSALFEAAPKATRQGLAQSAPALYSALESCALNAAQSASPQRKVGRRL